MQSPMSHNIILALLKPRDVGFVVVRSQIRREKKRNGKTKERVELAKHRRKEKNNFEGTTVSRLFWFDGLFGTIFPLNFGVCVTCVAI